MARKPRNTPRTRPERSNPHATLIDADRPLILTIGPRDISGATRGDGAECAAAHAICRQERVKRALVCKTKTYVWISKDVVLRYVTPRALRTEIMIYDRHGSMAGGEYRLLPPAGGQKLGSRPKPTGSKLTTGKRATRHIIENVRADAPKGHQQMARLLEGR